MAEFNIELLDVSDAEILNAPEPTAEPEPVKQVIEHARDVTTGKFVAQAPASAPDPVKASEPAPAAPAVPITVPITPPKEEPRVIPLAAHLEERNRWKQEIAERDNKLTQIQERIAKLEPQAPTPDFIEDPKAYVDAQTGNVTKELEALKSQAAQLAQEQQFSRFIQEISTTEASFVEQNPDYYDALGHVRGIRSQQLLEMYPEATKEQVEQALRSEELQAAAQFVQRGRNPAEMAYKIAKTFGYKKAEAVPVVAAKPNIPQAPVADPGNTLGSSGGAPSDEIGVDDLGEDPLEPFKMALSERFGKRR